MLELYCGQLNSMPSPTQYTAIDGRYREVALRGEKGRNCLAAHSYICHKHHHDFLVHKLGNVDLASWRGGLRIIHSQMTV